MKAKELEKIKFVLDYKYKELKKDIEPKESQIVQMREHMKEMDEELERDVRTNHALGQAVNDKIQKINNLNHEIQRQRRLVQDKDRVIMLFVADIEKLVTQIDPAYWRDGIKQLYRTYVKKQPQLQGPSEVEEGLDEFARQRAYLEKSLSTLRTRSQKNETAMKLSSVKRASENAELIAELNSLRKEKHDLELRCTELTNEIQRSKMQSPTSMETRSKPLATAEALPEAPRAQSRGKRIHHGTSLTWNEIVSTERSKVATMLQQLDENNREIEQQRLEIKRLREQIRVLVERGEGDLPGKSAATTPGELRQSLSAMAAPDRMAKSAPLGALRRLPKKDGGFRPQTAPTADSSGDESH